MPVRGRLILRWSVLIVMAVQLCLREASAVKRTMPMIGMDEDGEEIDPDEDTPATQQPRNALQSLISGLLGKNQSIEFVPINPVQREHLRQAQFASALDVMDDINGGNDKASNKAVIPNGKGSTSSGGIMSYHGGKIVSQPLSVYLIMYGDWASQPEVAHILADFLNNLGGTSWMNINSGYYDSSGNVGTSQVSHGGTCYDPYSHGKSLSDDDVLEIVKTCIGSGLPKSPNGAYFVISSADVAQDGFCTSYCGFHDDRDGLYFGFVGSVKRCPGFCQYQEVGPNGASAADGIASIFAHEVSEIISDPDATAWYDSRGEEGADKCSWKYGETWEADNGATANLKLNGKSYLIQMNWAVGQGCSMGW